MKKIIALLLVTMMVAAVFAGCQAPKTVESATTPETGTTTEAKTEESAKETKTKDAGKFTVWMLKNFAETSNQYFIDRSVQFGKENNLNVSVEMVPYAEFLTKWTAAIESGDTPDVTYMGYQDVGTFGSKGILMDVSDVFSQIDEREALYPSLSSAVSFEGAQYAIPYWTEPIVLHYRKDLLEAKGYTEPPKTWDEFREIAKAVNDPAGGIIGAGIGFGKSNSDAEWFARSVLWSYGAALFAEDGKSSIVNSAEAVAGAQMIADIFLEDKSVAAGAVNWDDSANNKAYLSGQAAMVINAGSVYNAVKNDDPELFEKTGIATLPAGPKGCFVPGVCNNLAVFKNSKNPEMAKAYLLYMTEPEAYREWIVGGAPLTCPIYASFKNDELWQDPVNKAFVNTVDNFVFLGYKYGYTPAAGEVYSMRLINDTFQRILVEKWTAQKALDELKANIDTIINK
ncbi:MAG: sugar ABC transporter substrate-binding protein [Clostridia bacterium]